MESRIANRFAMPRGGWIATVGAALLLIWGLAAPAAAGEADEPGRRVSFTVEAGREVPNDWIRAVVGATEEDADPAQAADRVNRAMGWALEQARAEARVKARSGGYHTQPVYHDGKLRRWRASQDLVLEGSDADAMTALLGTLQSRLQLRSFAFSVSDAQRDSVEGALVEEALAAFRARAELVRRSLEARRYEIDQISIETGRHGPPVPRMAMAMEASSSARVAPPPAEAGTSRLTVRVTGTIALE
jgi:predicted secreted protein